MEKIDHCHHVPVGTEAGPVCSKCGLVFDASGPTMVPYLRSVGRITRGRSGGLEAALDAIDAKHNPGLPDDDLDDQYRDEED